ncbi:MAG: hypothetical protein M3Y18_09120 [Candidatus Eremiobacteraeota bacterium]|nr:hypothetical protein [Candidatus Eremiobacteraeota bacterium]
MNRNADIPAVINPPQYPAAQVRAISATAVDQGLSDALKLGGSVTATHGIAIRSLRGSVLLALGRYSYRCKSAALSPLFGRSEHALLECVASILRIYKLALDPLDDRYGIGVSSTL